MGGGVDQALESFDNQPQTQSANRFFQQLNKEGFTEDPILFTTSTPLDSVKQQVWYWAAEWHNDKHNYERAKAYALKALPLYKSESGSKADCQNLLGIIHVRLGDFNKAADYAKQCLQIDLKSGDHDRISSSMNTLAGIYMAAKQPHEAERWILQAISHADQANNLARKAVLLGMASEIYHSLTQEEKALDYAQQAYDIETKLGRKLHAAIRLDQKATALIGLHRYEEAETALRTALPMLRQGNPHSLAIANNHLGTCLIWQKREAEAYAHFREAADYFAKVGDSFNELYARRGLCLSLWESHPDSARAELNRFNYLKDSLYTQNSAEALARINAELGNERLDFENRNLRMAITRILIIAAALLALIALGAWYVIKHHRRREQRHINELFRTIEHLRKQTPDNKQADTLSASPSPELPVATEPQPIPKPQTKETDDRFLKDIIQIINENRTNNDFSVETIASQLDMSVATFRRHLQSATGESPKVYIQAIVMDKARKLLDQGESIADVAYACGFTEPSSFTRTFRRLFAESPTDYRNRK